MPRFTLHALTAAALALGGLVVAPSARPRAAVRAAPLAAPLVGATALKWPPWLSIEWPVNPFDRTSEGALLLVHAAMHDHTPTRADLTGAAEGLVSGQRRTVPLHFDASSVPGIFSLRSQWPTEGTWLLRITLGGSTTAMVTLDARGDVASVQVPTRGAGHDRIPRSVTSGEIDATLVRLATRQE